MTNPQTKQAGHAAHTPGPWETSRDAVPPGHVQITIYAESTGERVATAFERNANAKLIAAAPELLSACKGAFQCIDAICHVRKGGEREWHFVRDMLKAAITKATGS